MYPIPRLQFPSVAVEVQRPVHLNRHHAMRHGDVDGVLAAVLECCDRWGVSQLPDGAEDVQLEAGDWGGGVWVCNEAV